MNRYHWVSIILFAVTFFLVGLIVIIKGYHVSIAQGVSYGLILAIFDMLLSVLVVNIMDEQDEA